MSSNPINLDFQLGNIRPLERNSKIILYFRDKTGTLPQAYKRTLNFCDENNPESSSGKCLFTFVCTDSLVPIVNRIVQPYTRVRINFDFDGAPSTFSMREIPILNFGEELEFKTRATIDGDKLVNHDCFLLDDDSKKRGRWHPLPEPENEEVARSLEEQKYKMLLYLRASLAASLYTSHNLEETI